MKSEAQWHAFYRTMDKLRRGPRRIEPIEVAEIARAAGLSPDEALLQIWEYERFGASRRGDTAEALIKFACALCKDNQNNSVLEYAVLPYLLTACLAESEKLQKLTYLTPYNHTANAKHRISKYDSFGVAEHRGAWECRF